jgi:hypothetical protein
VTAVDDLAGLGIDSAEARRLAVRDYIDEQGRIAEKQFNALWLALEFLDLCETNAAARLQGPWRRDHPVPLWAIDYLTARTKILSRYKGAARDRARDILDAYVPPALRKESNHVRR